MKKTTIKSKSKSYTGFVMNKLTREVNSQYLPQKIKEKQYADNPDKLEKENKNRQKKDRTFKSTLEYAGGVDEYLQMAKLVNKQYEPLQEQVVVQNIHNDNQEVKPNEYNKMLLNNLIKDTQVKLTPETPIQIPKRPKYIQGMKPRDFEGLENESYLNWRRVLSEVEQSNENLVITPYEKNITVWRQLWLTIEKCQVLIQIVDARNPLFFRSCDLENYIKEVDISKDYMLLINKADLLSEELRISWADYFKSKGIKFIFFSALVEDAKLPSETEVKNKEKKLQTISELQHLEDGDVKSKVETIMEDDVKIKNEVDPSLEKEVIKPQVDSNILKFYPEANKNEYKIYTREELIAMMKEMTKERKKYHNDKAFMFGFIGYPNVGKSSVINVLMQKKRVGVALMPGKTKHYQTLYLPNENDICLMDCPGLVFPSFTFSKADLVINGIMPIDKITDYLTPIHLIVLNIPKIVFERYYKIKLPDLYSSSQFLQVLATKHGYLTGRSLPDEAKTSKIVLKDYVSGHLLYCYPRPDYDIIKHGEVSEYLFRQAYGDELIQEVDVNNPEEKSNHQELLSKMRENNELLKQIPANFNDNYEKIGIETNKVTLKNYEDLDDDFFNTTKTDLSQAKIPKDVKMQLKFAMKRGELSEEQYENILTLEDAKEVLTELEKKKIESAKTGKTIVTKRLVDGY